METFPALLGTLGIALGIATLRFAWRKKTRMHSLITVGSWMIIVSGLTLWSLAGAADWGIALGTILFICVAMIILGFDAWPAFMKRQRKPRPAAKTDESQAFDETSSAVYAKHLSTFFLAAPLGGGVAIILTLSAFKLLQSFGVVTANSIVTTFFLTPLLWSAIATWMVIDKAIVRKATLLFCCAALGALHLGWVA